jgi:hypothetical protein
MSGLFDFLRGGFENETAAWGAGHMRRSFRATSLSYLWIKADGEERRGGP